MRAPRPSKPMEERRQTVSFRLSPQTRAMVERAAQESGRSTTQEVERRLEASFYARTQLHEGLSTAFDPQTGELLLLLGRAIRGLPPLPGTAVAGDWLSDPAASRSAVRQINTILNILQPPGEADPVRLEIAEAQATALMLGIADTSPQPPLAPYASRVRERLGPAVAERLIKWREKYLAEREGSS